MAAYETVIILDPTLDDDQAQAIFDDIQRRLTEEVGVEIQVSDHWGRRKLAYEVDRKTEGNYMFYRFTRDNLASTVDFSELERFLRFSENVMRFMIARISDAAAKAPVLRPEVFTYSPRPTRSGPPRGDRSAGAEAKPAEGAPATPAAADGEAKPAEGDAKPAEGEATPSEGEATPAEGEVKPAEGADAAPATPPAADEAEVKPAAEAEASAAPAETADEPAAAEDDAKA